MEEAWIPMIRNIALDNMKARVEKGRFARKIRRHGVKWTSFKG